MGLRSLRPVGSCLVLLAVLAAPPTARATTLVRLDLGQLVDLADGIFTGTAVHSEVAPSRDGRFPFTFVTFQVDSALKGTFPAREVVLRLQGGALGDDVTLVDGMPQFTVGESYLVFVYGNGRTASPVLGWVQGQFRFAREARSGKPILVDWRGAPLLGIDGERLERGRPQGFEPDAAASPGAVVLMEEGVEVRPVAEAAPRTPDQIPEASEILRQLQGFVRSRAGGPSFIPGRRVISADPFDVPERVGGSFAPSSP